MAAAVGDENQREPALVTFLVTASGVSLGGVGSAFWGLVAGVMTLVILRTAAGRG
jgi:benzoate membrane transport protein